MKKKIVLYGLFYLLLTGACSKGGDDGYGTDNGNNNGSSNKSQVSISNMKFASATLTVKAGTTVTWTNNEYVTHTVTADDNSFGSNDLNFRDTYQHTFADAGTYKYHCGYHPAMKATVTANE